MAEIKIEKKKPIWPWIILALVILALLYFFVFADDDNDDMEDVNTEQVEESTAWDDDTDTTTWDNETNTDWDNTGQGVAGYLTYISDNDRMGVDHEYTNNAIIQLINAVQAKADEMNYDISADMQAVRQDAQEIQRDPTATTHANKIKDAGTKLANVIEKMQMENYPNLSTDAQEVKTAAENINPSTETLQQRDQIKKFFDEAGDVLRKMS